MEFAFVLGKVLDGKFTLDDEAPDQLAALAVIMAEEQPWIEAPHMVRGPISTMDMARPIGIYGMVAE